MRRIVVAAVAPVVLWFLEPALRFAWWIVLYRLTGGRSAFWGKPWHVVGGAR